jgi:hypothetical protein
MEKLMLALLIILSCEKIELDTSQPSYDFTDTWLQLDNFYQDTCFYLNSEEYNTIIYDKGEAATEYKDWHWEFFEPDLFVIDEHELTVIKSGDCWFLEAYNITSSACECNLELP